MKYSIVITDRAQQDIEETLAYIDYTLKNPKAADELLNQISKELGSLESYPERFAFVSDDLLASGGIRKIIIKNYLAFYYINERDGQVVIVRFLYVRRDWKSILRDE